MPASQPPCVTLRAEERVAGRAFCDPAHTSRDLATLAHLREALMRAAHGRRASVIQVADEVGVHYLAVPDWAALETTRPVALIGFFGQARGDADHSEIVALERDIVGRAAGFPGLLAYHNARLANGQWGNLVVFQSHAQTARLAGDSAHRSAVARTPSHYASLRLHRGELPDGCLGAAAAIVSETLYLDFGESPAWRALRVYTEAGTASSGASGRSRAASSG